MRHPGISADRLVDVAGSGGNKLEGGFQNGFQHQCSPQNGCCQHLYPQGELQLPPTSPRSVSRSDPGSFQVIASALDLGACEILCVPFKSEVSISHNPLALPKISPCGLQSQMFWGHVFPAQVPWSGKPGVELGPLTP